MNEGQLSKLDALKNRLLNEYTVNGESDEYKKIIKRVVEIGSRMIHSAMTDISEVPNIKISFGKMIEKFETFEVMIKSLEAKVDLINHLNMQPNCKLQVEKIVYEIIKSETENNKKNISFAFEIVKFVLYLVPVIGTLIWAVMYVKGA